MLPTCHSAAATGAPALFLRARVRWLASAVGAIALLALAAAAWPFTVDDAFIVARYANRIASGQGYTFSGSTRTDGVTGPLWLLPLVLGARLGLDALSLAKAVSLTAALLALMAMTWRVAGIARGRRVVWWVPLVCCSSLPFIVWSVAGLETGLAALCASCLALAVTRRPRASGTLMGLSFAALAWLRPELLAFATCLLLALTLRSSNDLGERGAVFRAWTIGLSGLLLVLAFRSFMFGHLLPMSASAKPALLGHGFRYVGETLLRARVWVLVPLLACAVRFGGRHARTLALALLVHAAAVCLVGGDWMPGRRLFAPLVPVLALTLALGLRSLAARRPYAHALCAAALLVASALELLPELPAVRAAGRTRELSAPRLAAWICAARGPVALIDLGVLGASCPQQTFIDLGGLTEPAIAYARGAHLDKQIDLAWLRSRAPGLVVLHSRQPPRVDSAGNLRWFAGYPVERRVLGAPFMRDYEVQHVFAYAPEYFYVLLAPRRSGTRASTAP
ncbi:MAG: hypothetical protein JWN04_1730 [Myxococcaceae bacterium]|nr:hypothetical protein [Myxococcaceae bacterium]